VEKEEASSLVFLCRRPLSFLFSSTTAACSVSLCLGEVTFFFSFLIPSRWPESFPLFLPEKKITEISLFLYNASGVSPSSFPPSALTCYAVLPPKKRDPFLPFLGVGEAPLLSLSFPSFQSVLFSLACFSPPLSFPPKEPDGFFCFFFGRSTTVAPKRLPPSLFFLSWSGVPFPPLLIEALAFLRDCTHTFFFPFFSPEFLVPALSFFFLSSCRQPRDSPRNERNGLPPFSPPPFFWISYFPNPFFFFFDKIPSPLYLTSAVGRGRVLSPFFPFFSPSAGDRRTKRDLLFPPTKSGASLLCVKILFSFLLFLPFSLWKKI